MERLTERYGDGYIAIKGCTTAYRDEERKGRPASNAIVRLAAYEDTMPLERAQELSKAEKDGRMVVLPCKVGAHLWRVTYPYRKEAKVTEFVVKNFRTTGKKHLLQLEVQAVNVPVKNWMYYNDFFLTREEAEAALKKREVENQE